MAKEVKQWITIEGKHIPIFEGQSKDAVVKNYIKHNHPGKKGEFRSTQGKGNGPEVTVKPGTKVTVRKASNGDLKAAIQETISPKHKGFGGTDTVGNETKALKEGAEEIKKAQDKKAEQIAQNKAEADRLNKKSNTNAKDRDEKFINDLVKEATAAIPVNGEFDADDLMSNGDIQSIVEAYAIMYKGVNEDKLLNEIRNRIDAQLKHRK